MRGWSSRVVLVGRPKPYDMNPTLHLVDILVAPACLQCRRIDVNVTQQVAPAVARANLRIRRVSLRDSKTSAWKVGSKSMRVATPRRDVGSFGGHTCIKCEQESVLEHGGIRCPVTPESAYVDTHTPTARKTGDAVAEELHHGGQNGSSNEASNGASVDAPIESTLEKEAWELLREAVVSYCGEPVGTIAANDPSDTHALNYDQVFIRDFIPSAVAFLLKGETDIVRNFLLHTLQLQSWEKTVDCYSPGQGLMPASFKVRSEYIDGKKDNGTEEILDPDFGEAAIGRVAPVDSGLWWIILLRAYGKCTGDKSVQDRVDVQTGIKMILKVCLSDGFDMFPTLLVTDGSCMIDRRLGIHGHPLEIQALFYQALRCAREILLPGDGAQDLIRQINSRLAALSFHIQQYYWLDIQKLNEIYRYKTEEYSTEAVNKFNIYPDQVSEWLLDWLPESGGYFIGNLQPAHMDFRWFTLGNIWSICGGLATQKQSEDILRLVESKWKDLVATMPMKICFPALTEDEWRIITGADPKNTAWSYHNGGSWPTLLWQFTVACIKMNRPDLAEKAVAVAEKRLSRDRWPEYYDTKQGRFIGKQARLYQTWSISGYLTSKLLLKNPEAASWFTCDEDDTYATVLEANPKLKRKFKASPNIFLI